MPGEKLSSADDVVEDKRWPACRGSRDEPTGEAERSARDAFGLTAAAAIFPLSPSDGNQPASGGPTRRELSPGSRDTHPLSSIEKRYALLPICCAVCKPEYTSLRVAKPTLNGITRASTSSLPTGAPHTAGTEHDRDSRRRFYYPFYHGISGPITMQRPTRGDGLSSHYDYEQSTIRHIQ